MKDFYVDNLLTGTDNISTIIAEFHDIISQVEIAVEKDPKTQDYGYLDYGFVNDQTDNTYNRIA